MDEFTIVKSYRQDEALRQSFNKLAEETFGLSFEDWYQNGYWSDNYNPYSIVYQGEIVANVSVNTMDMCCDGVQKRFIQLGTVMTRQDSRGQGLSRRLMVEIEKDYAGKVDGIYLFANDSVLDFYPKFGFKKAKEYQYWKEITAAGPASAVHVPMKEKTDWRRLEKAIMESCSNSSFGMDKNVGLIMFYVTKFMQNNVYYVKTQDAWVIAETDDDTLFLQEVIASTEVNLDEIVKAFGKEIKKVVLGFIPLHREGYQVKEVQEEDTTLFVDEKMAESEKHIMFPVLSHA